MSLQPSLSRVLLLAQEQTGEVANEVAEEVAETVRSITADEIAAWLLTGLLAGAIAAAIFTRTPRGFGVVGNLVIGLVGAFIAGLVTEFVHLEFDWGDIVIGFDELLFALIGSIIVLSAFWWLRGRVPKRSTKAAAKS